MKWNKRWWHPANRGSLKTRGLRYRWYQIRMDLIHILTTVAKVPPEEFYPLWIRWIKYLLFPWITLANRLACVQYDSRRDVYTFGTTNLVRFELGWPTLVHIIHRSNSAYAIHVRDAQTVAIYEIPQCGQMCLRQHKLCRFTTLEAPPSEADLTI